MSIRHRPAVWPTRRLAPLTLLLLAAASYVFSEKIYDVWVHVWNLGLAPAYGVRVRAWARASATKVRPNEPVPPVINTDLAANRSRAIAGVSSEPM